jgi:hypothetical protein
MKRTRLIQAMAGVSLMLLLAAPAVPAGQPGAAGSYEVAVQMAAAQGLPLVLDFYTDW